MNLGFDFLGLILYGLGMAIGIVLVARGITVPRGVKCSSWCGRCGYELPSVEQGVCPECGVAHSVAGVVTPAVYIRLRGSTFLLNAGWALFFLLAAVPIYWAVIGIVALLTGTTAGSGSMVTDKTISAQLRPAATAIELVQAPSIDEDPTGKRFLYTIDFDGTTRTRGSRLLEGSLEMVFVNTPTDAEIEINLVDMAWVITFADGSQTEGDGFGEDTARAFYVAAGLDVSNAVTEAEMMNLVAHVNKIIITSAGTISLHGATPVPGQQSAGYLRMGPRGSSVSSMPAPALSTVGPREVGLVVGFVIFLTGLVVLNKKRSRMLKDAMVG